MASWRIYVVGNVVASQLVVDLENPDSHIFAHNATPLSVVTEQASLLNNVVEYALFYNSIPQILFKLKKNTCTI